MDKPLRSTTIRVEGAVEAVLEPLWGQKTIWQWHGMVDEKEAYFANGKAFRIGEHLPGTCPPDVLADAIGQVLHRHDALRTTLEIADGTLAGQVVHGSGELTVELYAAADYRAGAALADEIAAGLSGQPWTCREWPVRMAMVMVAGSVRFLVMSHNRMVLDVQSLDFLMADVAMVAGGRTGDLVERWQAVAEARHERSPQRAAERDLALAYWHDELSACPPSMFDYPSRTPDGLRFVLAQMESAALARAAGVLRRRWRVTGGALVLGALAVVLGQYTGHRTVSVQLLAGNRTDRRRRHMLGTLISEGLVRVDLDGRSLAQIAAATARSISAGHRFAYCDPDAVRDIREAVAHRAGAHLDLAVYYNDMQTAQVASAEVPEPTAEELAALVADGSALAPPESWAGWDQVWQAKVTRKDVRLLLTAQHGPQMPLLLSGDTVYLPRQAMGHLLCGIERLLVAAAVDGDVPPADLARVTGVEQVRRGPSWVRCGTSWVDLAATRAAWQAVTGTAPGTVLVEPVPAQRGGDRLVGYVGGTPAPALPDLHRRMLAAVGGRNDIQAPAWYRCVGATPANPADDRAWRDAPVRTQGHGRDGDGDGD